LPQSSRRFPAASVCGAAIARSLALNRFALAIGALAMLETARIGGEV